MMSFAKKVSFVFVAAAGILVIVYAYLDLRKPGPTPTDAFSPAGTSTPITIETDGSGNPYTVTIIDDEPAASGTKPPSPPDISYPLQNKSNLPAEAFMILRGKAEFAVEALKKNPNDGEKWLQLALFRKMSGDYIGAVEVLEYMSVLWPDDYVIYHNMADIQQYYLKNYPLAEKNWLKTIELKPEYIQAYENLYTLSEVHGGREKGVAILLKGLERNPASTELMVHSARYYRSVGNREKSLYYYNKAIQEAGMLGNNTLRDTLVSERDELSR